MERGPSERLCWGGGGLLRAWLLRACLRAAVGRGLVWARGRRRSCAAVSPGEVFFQEFVPVTRAPTPTLRLSSQRAVTNSESCVCFADAPRRQ